MCTREAFQFRKICSFWIIYQHFKKMHVCIFICPLEGTASSKWSTTHNVMVSCISMRLEGANTTLAWIIFSSPSSLWAICLHGQLMIISSLFPSTAHLPWQSNYKTTAWIWGGTHCQIMFKWCQCLHYRLFINKMDTKCGTLTRNTCRACWSLLSRAS